MTGSQPRHIIGKSERARQGQGKPCCRGGGVPRLFLIQYSLFLHIVNFSNNQGFVGRTTKLKGFISTAQRPFSQRNHFVPKDRNILVWRKIVSMQSHNESLITARVGPPQCRDASAPPSEHRPHTRRGACGAEGTPGSSLCAPQELCSPVRGASLPLPPSDAI